MELEPQVLRDEAQWCILGGADLISLKDRNRTSFLVLSIVWQGNVKKYPPPAGRMIISLFRAIGFFLDRAQMRAACRFTLLFVGSRPFVKPIQDAMAFPPFTQASDPLCCPSDPLDWGRYIAIFVIWLNCHCENFEQ